MVRSRDLLDRSLHLPGRVVRRAERAACGPLGVYVYHSIGRSPSDPWGLTVAPGNFSQHLAAMRAMGTVVDLEHSLAGDGWRRPRRSGRRFAVTFDDGYVDNLVAALPALERHDVPATVFIATHFLGRPYFWWDRLAELVLAESSASIGLAELATAFVATDLISLNDVAAAAFVDRGALHAQLYARVVVLAPARIAEVLDRVSAEVGFTSRSQQRPMTVEELHGMAGHPLVSIGAHTVNHRQLTGLSADVVHSELVDGDRALDALLGRQRRLLAYPYGMADRTTAGVAERAGFRRAFTTVSRPISGIDPGRLLPRLATADVDGPSFKRAVWW